MDKNSIKRFLYNLQKEAKFAELCKQRLKERELKNNNKSLMTPPEKYTSGQLVSDVFGSSLVQGKTFSQTVKETEINCQKTGKVQIPVEIKQNHSKNKPSSTMIACVEETTENESSVNDYEVKKTCDNIFLEVKPNTKFVNKIDSSEDDLNILGDCQLLASNRFYLLNDYEGTKDEILGYKDSNYEEVTYKEKTFRVRRPLMPKYKVPIKESIIEEYFNEPIIAGLHPLEFAYITTPIYRREKNNLKDSYASFVLKVKEIREKIYLHSNLVKVNNEQSWIKSMGATDLYYLFGEPIPLVK
jgi:hypothetical protein